MSDRPRILLLGAAPDELRAALAAADVVAAGSPAEAADRLREGAFAAVVADPARLAAVLDTFGRGETVLTHTDRGIATLDPGGRVTWANPALRQWCPGDLLGRPLMEAFDPDTTDAAVPTVVASDEADPLAAAAAGRPAAFRVHRPRPAAQPYLDVRVTPVAGAGGGVAQLVAIITNVTAEVEQQQKLDALHRAGRDLAALEADQLAEMTVPTRVELLKQNLRRYVHNLLRYDTIEVRLLDRQTGELRPLLEDGMTPDAANRVLFARPTGNGVTGHVAYTGESYLCPDTGRDPLYLEGAEGAKSSLTVPLKYNDEVIGTLNVESPRVNGFGPADQQFTELFSKEIAAALHTLDLLSAQATCTRTQSIEQVSREIALPVDEVLASASLLYARLHGGDPEAARHLRRILEGARQVKDSVQRIGREAAAAPDAGPAPLAGRRVLVVEQDERLRRQAHQLLGRLGAAVVTAGTAAEGLALAGGGGYDAVFMELRPADMGGYDAYRRFRGTGPAVHVCLTTGFGYDSNHCIVKARTDGLRHVLFKPFKAEQVVRAVLDPAPAAGANPLPAAPPPAAPAATPAP